ncbi:NAD(P)H-hydrate dehydratase [Shewanella waksmanii]|uniref:NAD(P)H-hydrate dehydratase n=1 Tax=Shewanella waksmanii TaxID=213783 RepID=UPI003735FD39
MLYQQQDLPATLYSCEQVKQAELKLIASGISEHELIERAATASFNLLQAQEKLTSPIAIIAGYGNNGADAFTLATLLIEAGQPVAVYFLFREKISVGVQQGKADFIAAGGQVGDDIDSVLTGAEVVVDGLLGTGFKGEVSGEIATAIEKINASNAWVLSLDIPSGINGDTGFGAKAVNADTTITFGALKQGLITGKAREHTGELIFADIGFADVLNKSEVINVTAAAVPVGLPYRPQDSHKGMCGKVTVIGGDQGMAGAPRLAAEACLRSGAGLVTVVSHPSHHLVISAGRPELMFWGCELVDMEVYLRFGWANVLLIGPGLGQQDWGYNLFKAVGLCEKPCVVDADALNLLSKDPRRHDNWVLTPHSAEAARLLGIETDEVEQDRFAAVKAIQAKYGGVVVLKGPGTLIYDGNICHVAPVGNAGLASGGSGDVLGGIIAALMAQKMSLMAAATAAVVIHGRAAEYAAEQGMRGMLASDLFEHIRRLVDEL